MIRTDSAMTSYDSPTSSHTTAARPGRPAARLALLVALAALSLLSVRAQTTGANPPNVAAGAPAGSYSLSGFEDVNLFSGNLNFNLPLLQAGGRGRVAAPYKLAVN